MGLIYAARYDKVPRAIDLLVVELQLDGEESLVSCPWASHSETYQEYSLRNAVLKKENMTML
jgi:hypothetical protein